jgi:NAD(P)-dependent dehydrogenase (short-subunit alcohol dehydrogenase family)
MDLELKGKRVLVTGGSKGIGRATAEALATEGCRVMITSRDAKMLEAAAKGIESRTGSNVTWTAMDLAQRGAPEALAAAAGDLDILVNNAGAIPGGDLIGVDEEAWRHGWDLKVFGYINLTRVVYAKMKVKRAGVILNIIGSAGERMNSAYIAGSTGNAALMAFTRALGGASHADGVRVLGINPGPVETERLVTLNRKIAETQLGDANRYRELFQSMPFGRPGRPEEIADGAAFLVSPRSSYTSGCIVTIDGGKANH